MKNLIACLLFLTSTAAYTESTLDVSSIRNRYQQVNRGISEKTVYCDRVVINEAGDGYPAVGIFKKTYEFHYIIEEGTKPRLQKCHIRIQRSAMDTYCEILLGETGELLFAYFKDDQDPQGEIRLYFKDHKPYARTDPSGALTSPDNDSLKRFLSAQELAVSVKEMFGGLQRTPEP